MQHNFVLEFHTHFIKLDIPPSNLNHKSQGLGHLLGRQGKHVWLIVRQTSTKADWWDAPLVLWDLVKTICMILTMEGNPFCFHWGFLAVKFLPQLPSHLTPLSQWAHLLQISTQTLPTINTQTQQLTNNPLHHLHTFTLLLSLGRYTAPALPKNLPFFFFRHASTQPIKIAPRIQQ